MNDLPLTVLLAAGQVGARYIVTARRKATWGQNTVRTCPDPTGRELYLRLTLKPSYIYFIPSEFCSDKGLNRVLHFRYTIGGGCGIA